MEYPGIPIFNRKYIDSIRDHFPASELLDCKPFFHVTTRNFQPRIPIQSLAIQVTVQPSEEDYGFPVPHVSWLVNRDPYNGL